MTDLQRWFAFVALICVVLLRWFVWYDRFVALICEWLFCCANCCHDCFALLICVCCSDLRCFVALIYVMWLIKTCNMTRSWQTHLSVTWLILTFDMTRSWHTHSSVTWLILTCDMTRWWRTHSCEHDSFQWKTWMIHVLTRMSTSWTSHVTR